MNRMNDLIEGCKITGSSAIWTVRISMSGMDVNLLQQTGRHGVPEAESVSDEHL